MKIGVISDTHLPGVGRKLPKKLLEELRKVDLIVHAGDLTEEKYLNCLKSLNEVKAVAGNRDSFPLQEKLNEQLSFEIANKKISVIHGHQFGGRNVLQSLNYSFPESDVIIFGHTHRPVNEELGGKLFFNPGSPTDKRLEKNHTFGIIDIGDKVNGEIKILEEGS
ncbi:metallophosphoesterase family protein [Halanaerobium hydrogeniformans]|uniref:Phosphoesterase n=1 Tax=Halanaerobium hydrogeniformans TaxID=656519 RepID=E4RJ21_HALHG|nr:metallophosphoesterase [Halanaerobium hydrogeniformans]ADQ15241.1 phosphodiesterase, MJ0936 family [Halanaerobium hydrogeniformans]